VGRQQSTWTLRGGKGKGGKGGGGKSSGPPQIVSLKQGKKHFEILAKNGAAGKFKEGKISAEDAIEIEQVFYDAKKMTKASDADLKGMFGTSDQLECCTKILEKGDYSLSTSERKEKMDQKTEEIMKELILNYRLASSKTPPIREQLEVAFKEAKIKIDTEKPTKNQIADILPKLQPICALEIVETDYVIRFNCKYGSVLSIIKKYAEVKSTKKDAADFFVCDVGIPPSKYDELIRAIQKPTEGDFEIDTIGSKNEPKAAKMKPSDRDSSRGSSKKHHGKDKSKSKKKGSK